MIVKGITDECFTDYKLPSMYIAFPHCSFKCDKDCGRTVCQNSSLALSKNIIIPTQSLIDRYIHNPITKAIVLGGLEPFDDYAQLLDFIARLREQTKDTIVVYTGYTENEIFKMHPELEYWLIQKGNIIIKFGRFRPDEEHHKDDLLGVELASPNQYAKAFGVE